MSKVRQLIEKAIDKKPLDVREIIEDIMKEKVRDVIAESMDSFDYEGEALTEEEEMQAFFEEFHAEYGHLPMEEQEEIMNSLMSDELTEEEEQDASEEENEEVSEASTESDFRDEIETDDYDAEEERKARNKNNRIAGKKKCKDCGKTNCNCK